MSRYKQWSPEDDAKLIEMYDAGVHPAEIARMLGRTRGSCDIRWRKIKKAAANADSA